jgi:hypothetical protein
MLEYHVRAHEIKGRIGERQLVQSGGAHLTRIAALSQSEEIGVAPVEDDPSREDSM